MDTQKQSDSVMQSINITSHPAYLWIGNEATLIEQTEKTLLQTLCAQSGCKTCTNCKHLLNRQHSKLLWLCPEKNYTIDQLEPLFTTISFSLEPESHFFFVLQKADFFNQTCANALLKILEEPPHGYHFILLAQRLEYILPTIRSRCLIKQFHAVAPEEAHQLISWFKHLNLPDPITFWQSIDKSTLSERDSLELLDELLAYWSKQCTTQNKDVKKHKQARRMVTLLKNALEKPPMPGSSKIFWKNLYLSLYTR